MRCVAWAPGKAARSAAVGGNALPCARDPVQSWLGVLIMLLVVAYHYVTADPRYEAHRAV